MDVMEQLGHGCLGKQPGHRVLSMHAVVELHLNADGEREGRRWGAGRGWQEGRKFMAHGGCGHGGKRSWGRDESGKY